MDSTTKPIHDKLVTEGWERRSVLNEPRLSEVVQEYEELGFEVHLEIAASNDPETGCNVCFNPSDTIRIVYTRKMP